jgi:single-stranded DNA-binding protein
MRLAVNDQPGQPPLFIDVATFGASAAAREKYLAKGRQIAVTGRLVYREWQAPDGTRRSKHAVIARVRFGARPSGQPIQGDGADSADNADVDVGF